jgi:hypothetical protein
MNYLKIKNRGASVMAIFVCTLKNLILGMVAGTRKSRKGLFLSLQTSVPFLFFREVYMKRIIESEKINMDSFEKGYKAACRGRKDNEKVQILFDKDGNWTGHVWGSNCSYSESDLERNRDFVLGDNAELYFDARLREWEKEIFEEPVPEL